MRRTDLGLGVRFDNWIDTVQAHLGLLLAFSLRDGELDAAGKRLALIRHQPRYPSLKAEQRGTIRSTADFAGRWNDDQAYSVRLANLAGEIKRGG